MTVLNEQNTMQMLQYIWVFLSKQQDSMLKLLETMVQIESGNTDKAGCDTMCSLVEGELRALQVETRRVPMSEKGDFLHGVWGDCYPGAPILFSGHMDTVFPKGTLRNIPFRIHDGKAFGPGCLDMKAGLVVAIFALRALQESGFCGRPIHFAFAGDEENGHRASSAAEEYRAAAKPCVAVFNFETGYPNDGLVVGRKGSCRFTVEIDGIASHAGNAPEKGRSAILEAAHQVIALQALNDLPRGTSLNVGLISGGTCVNAVPDYCRLEVDVRFTSRQHLDALLEKVKHIIATPVVRGTHATLAVSSINEVMEASQKNLWLFSQVKVASDAIEYPGTLHPIQVGGWSDANLAAGMGIPAICAMGACGEGHHTTEEFVTISSLVPRAMLAAASVLMFQENEQKR